MKIALALLGSALLLTGCCSSGRVIPDPAIPHQLVDEVCVTVWATQADGRLAPVKMRAPAGWWIAGPPVVTPSEGSTVR